MLARLAERGTPGSADSTGGLNRHSAHNLSVGDILGGADDLSISDDGGSDGEGGTAGNGGDGGIVEAHREGSSDEADAN